MTRSPVARPVLALLWWMTRATLFRQSPTAWHSWRRTLLRRFGAKIASTARIEPTVRIDFPWNLEVGPGVYVARRCILHCEGRVVIGPGCMLGPDVHVCAATHAYEDRTMPIIAAPITLGSEVWVAADAFVGPGVTIGDRCVLVARSSAFADLPAERVCVGEPARPRAR